MDKDVLDVVQKLIGTVDALAEGVDTLCARLGQPTGGVTYDARNRLKVVQAALDNIANRQTLE
ncbi:hypothetical protein [Gluconobacter kondonii]|uniref:hypothetical protein n=1 Tax=Gluconobacter kondonii TaxID=941463 RepID=UPI0019806725|nr:hypothetical protein [Gluconobacter kondonii]MBN3867509.1 hypothetical protein [Gluconobacter kondonii]MBS1053498.1 hypothetical protein [Gluconobacter kondonii]MBS1057160.1 hypothetical protein [Gluconobacter kondonii]MBS1066876.1 hypothetical protein [Gluconobacter kondonii]MBS1077879.1 hypothetical protein [Gluconobacter kondonii]